MIKIAFVIDSITTPSAGTEKQLLLLLNSLDRSHFQPCLICLQDSAWLRSQTFSFDVLKYDINSLASYSHFSGLKHFVKFCRDEKIDIVQTFFSDANKFGIMGAHLAGVPAAIASRRNIGHGHSLFTLSVLRFISKWTNFYLANSRAAGKIAIKLEKADPDKVKIIYNILELEKYKNIKPEIRAKQRKKWNVADDETVIGITANLRDVKNVDSLIRAASNLIKDYPKLKFISIGEGPDRQKLQNLIDKLGLNNSFLLDGSHSDIIPCLAGFDMAVLCSSFESFSNSLIEYMAVGLPIVASSAGGNIEAVTHEQSGLIYDLKDEKELEKSLRRLLDDSALANSLGKKAQKSAFERFSKETIINQYQNFYESLAGKPKTKQPVKMLGLSPGKIFSGFEKSFFDALRAEAIEIKHFEVEIPWFRFFCTLTSFHPERKKWGTRRDLHYHTSIAAFKRKSTLAQKEVLRLQTGTDAVYQVGGLWNPVNDKTKIPLILQVDYTSLLSKKRNSEWKRKPGREEKFWIEKEKILYNTAAIVLTTTENARKSIINDYGIDPDHVITVGGGVSSPYDKPDTNKFPDYESKKILFIGKGYIGKGLDTILDAFIIVKKKIPKAELTVVGPTDFSTDIKGVNYLGRIADRNKVKELYYRHALFVMPSRFEPLGQVFLEAMSCQLPCIGSTLDAMPELIDHGKTGYLIEAGDSDMLAEYMIDILTDPAKARQMGTAGFNKLSQNFTWPIVARKIVESISSTLNINSILSITDTEV